MRLCKTCYGVSEYTFYIPTFIYTVNFDTDTTVLGRSAK